MAGLNYLDFSIVLNKANGGYKVQVAESPAGRGNGDFSKPFNELELENFYLRVGRTRQSVRSLKSHDLRFAKEVGGKLFDEIFKGEVERLFQLSYNTAQNQKKGLRIRLEINAPELNNLPWEFLYNSKQQFFLGWSRETPIVRFLNVSQFNVNEILPVQLPLKILVMISSPDDSGAPLDTEREWNKLMESLQDLKNQGLVVLKRMENATLNNLRLELDEDDYHILHFIGHGKFNTDADQGELLFEDEQNHSQPFSGQHLGAILHDHRSSIRLVVLNACEGARTSNTDAFAGVGQTLVLQGIPSVIAMQFEITDKASITFSKEFYREIAQGSPVDAALAEARKAIFAQGNDIEWGTPVLFMRVEDGRVFDVDASVIHQKSKKPEIPTSQNQPDKPENERPKTPPSPVPKPLKWKSPPLGIMVFTAIIAVFLLVYSQMPGVPGMEKTETPPITIPPTDIKSGPPPVTLANTPTLEPATNIPTLVPSSTSTETNTATPSPSYTPTASPTQRPSQTPTATPQPPTPTNPPAPTTNTQPTPLAPFILSEKNNSPMILIPAGTFTMGSGAGERDEQPVHTVTLSDFYIDKYEVSFEQLAAFLTERGNEFEGGGAWFVLDLTNIYQSGSSWIVEDDIAAYPVMNVSWYGAKTFCEWRGGRLPTEAEWEKAARGSIGASYPWGEEVVSCELANFGGCGRASRRVGNYPAGASVYGVLDMAGNVWEWVVDWYADGYYTSSPDENPTGPLTPQPYKVIRGGSWENNRESLRSSNREWRAPSLYDDNLGFRCVQDP